MSPERVITHAAHPDHEAIASKAAELHATLQEEIVSLQEAIVNRGNLTEIINRLSARITGIRNAPWYTKLFSNRTKLDSAIADDEDELEVLTKTHENVDALYKELAEKVERLSQELKEAHRSLN